MKNLCYYLLLGLIVFICSAQSNAFNPENQSNFFIIDGMQVEWEFNDDDLSFKLHSPYQGWVSLGFNTVNDIVNANLVMGAVENNDIKQEEFFVVNFADQKPIVSLGGQSSVTAFSGSEDQSGTNFEFTINTNLQDEFHHSLKEGQKIWLICAYSMADDFGHHSIMRRHIEVTL